MTACRFHCRACGCHFTSLEAFDGHREGPAGSNRACTFPDDSRLVERTGICEIGDPAMPVEGVTIYAARPGRAADYFGSVGGRQTLAANAREAVPA